MRKSSIEKIDEQINMLAIENLVEKPKTKKIKKVNKNPKKILEEPTIIEDDLMHDLLSDDEKTKVYGKNDIQVNNKEEYRYVTKKIKTLTLKKIDYEKMYDVYIPLGIIVLIIFFIFLIIFI